MRFEYTADPIPHQCVELYNTTKEDQGNYVFEDGFWKWFVISAVAVSYICCITFIFKKRKKVAFHTRSPFIIIIGLSFLCIDTILNTIIFSSTKTGDVYRYKCRLSIVATCLGMFGYLMCLGLRMWRVFKVYQIYNEYLDNQKRALGIKSS